MVLTEAVARLSRDVADGQCRRLNRCLSEAINHVADMGPDVALAYLGATYALRGDLPAWFHLLDAVVRELGEGKNPFQDEEKAESGK